MRFDLAQAQPATPKHHVLGTSNTQSSKASTFKIDMSSSREVEAAPSAAPARPAPPSPFALRDMMLLQNRDVSLEERADYEHMLSEFTAAKNQGQDPVDFLRNLSKKGIDLLKKAHSFPANMRVDIENMSEEEAINFIVPDSAQVDLNNDGLIGSANGSKSFRFPPPNAPQDVKDAWETAMDGLSEKDQFLAQGQFMVMHFSANVTHDSAGNPVGFRDPDDPGFINPFAAENFSYRDMVNKMLDQLEASKTYNSIEQYEFKNRILTRFANAMERQGVQGA